MPPERVLVVHNAYQQRGGEDSVVADEVQLLRDRGHAVRTYLRENGDVPRTGRVQVALDASWSRRTVDEIGALIAAFRPAVVHVHNTLPLVSPSLYWACAAAGVPVVQTLHNFRLACPQAMFLREGKVCEDCLGKTPWPALRHGCYRNSRTQTAVVVAMLALHRGIGTYRHKIARYIALNDFCRSKFVAAGLPAERIAVKPNFVDMARPADPQLPRDGFLFVGRLAPEKGIDLLAEVWRDCGDLELRVAGVGASGALLARRPGVTMLGALPPRDVRDAMQRSLALVLPSIWYENCPRTLVEAFGNGLPVIASRIGALAELVEHGVDGLLFEAGDADDFRRTVRWAAEHPLAMARMGDSARARFEALYTPDINYGQLRRIYREAIDEHEAIDARSTVTADD